MSRHQRLLLVVHHDPSDLGQVRTVLEKLGQSFDICCPMTGDELPAPQVYDRAIVFGGSYSAMDDHLAEIRSEIKWLERAFACDTALVGICLGAQLMARALGAPVLRPVDGECEVGFVTITPTAAGEGIFPPDARLFFQWHEDGFEVPDEAVLLARGQAFPNQAFAYRDHSFAFQFHPESSAPQVREWMTVSTSFLDRQGADKPEKQFADFAQHGSAQRAWLEEFLTGWLGKTSREPQGK